jgi:hypothetical protein
MKRAITISTTAPALIPAFFLLLRRRGTGVSVRVVTVVRVRVDAILLTPTYSLLVLKRTGQWPFPDIHHQLAEIRSTARFQFLQFRSHNGNCRAIEFQNPNTTLRYLESAAV